MTDSDYARRQIEVLRSLLAGAGLYRAVSGSTALAGGLLSLGGFATAYYAKHHRHHPLSPGEFRVVWLAILGLTLLAGLFLLWRGSTGPVRAFFSPALRCAARTVAPPLIVGAVLTFLLRHPIQLALVWMIFYGLALLAAQAFAPRGLAWLGAAFLVTSCGMAASWRHLFVSPARTEPSALVVSGILAATFGGFHLAYAAAVWAFGETKAEAGPPG